MITLESIGRRHPALQSRDFRRIFANAFFASASHWTMLLARGWLIFELTGHAGWVGAATFAGMIPLLLAGPIGGALADRADRRRMRSPATWSAIRLHSGPRGISRCPASSAVAVIAFARWRWARARHPGRAGRGRELVLGAAAQRDRARRHHASRSVCWADDTAGRCSRFPGRARASSRLLRHACPLSDLQAGVPRAAGGG